MWQTAPHTKHTIQDNNILDTCCISANPIFLSVNNSDLYKTNMADIYNFSMSITDWRWKESDKVQLNGADFYLWRQYIELAVGDWKEEKYVSQQSCLFCLIQRIFTYLFDGSLSSPKWLILARRLRHVTKVKSTSSGAGGASTTHNALRVQAYYWSLSRIFVRLFGKTHHVFTAPYWKSTFMASILRVY